MIWNYFMSLDSTIGLIMIVDNSLNPYVKAAEYFLFINITIKMWFFFSIPCFRYWEIKIEGVCSMVRYFISFFFNLQVFSHTMIRTFFLLILPLIAFTYGMFCANFFLFAFRHINWGPVQSGSRWHDEEYISLDHRQLIT